MSNITLAIDDGLLEAARKVAAENGMSLNAYIRDFLQRNAERKVAKDQAKHYATMVKDVQGDSGGWKFKREELYEDRW
ncbi:MAG: BrnA antitoxin family protein [Candidatus Nomurabacteria bacterium]|jgi:antitoxin component of RelBE/YafQ-DinJ toxin-antitoxin module|nr:BrnA antitoxin family protein [Candidatus Nomurabacteria bacterium]